MLRTGAWLLLSLFPFTVGAADCLVLKTQSLGEISIPLPSPDARAARQRVSYEQEIEVPAERCTFQAGVRQCDIRGDRLAVGFELEREGDKCKLVDSHIVGGGKRMVSGREVEVPELKTDKSRFACSTLISACR